MNKTVQHPAPKPKQRTGQKHDSTQSSEKQRSYFQSIAAFSGRLHLEDDKIHLHCPDGAKLRVCGIDPKLALWLISHPGEMFAPVDRPWAVYPRSHRSGALNVYLKGLIQPDQEFSIAPDAAKIRGKLLAADGEKMTIGIRRNLSPAAFKELASKRMIQGTEFDQFTVNVWGQPPAEVGAIVELMARREADRLVYQMEIQ